MTNKNRTFFLLTALIMLISLVVGAIPGAAAEDSTLEEFRALFAVPEGATAVEKVDELGRPTEYYVDDVLVMVRKNIGNGSTEVELYDAAGNVTMLMSAFGDHIVVVIQFEKTVNADGSYEITETVVYNSDMAGREEGERTVYRYDANGRQIGYTRYGTGDYSDFKSEEMNISVNADGFEVRTTVYGSREMQEVYLFSRSDNKLVQAIVNSSINGETVQITQIRVVISTPYGMYLDNYTLTEEEWIPFYYDQVFAVPAGAEAKEVANSYGTTDTEYYVNDVLVMAKNYYSDGGCAVKLFDAAGNVTRQKQETATGTVATIYRIEKTIHDDGSYEIATTVEYHMNGSTGERYIELYDANGKRIGFANYDSNGALMNESHTSVNADGFEVETTTYSDGRIYESYLFLGNGGMKSVVLLKDSTGEIKEIYANFGTLTVEEWIPFYYDQVFAVPAGAEAVETENEYGQTDTAYYVNNVLVMTRKYGFGGSCTVELYDAAGNVTLRRDESSSGELTNVYRAEKTEHADGTYEVTETVEYSIYPGPIGSYTIYSYDADGEQVGWTEYSADGVFMNEMRYHVNADGFKVRTVTYSHGDIGEIYYFPQDDGTTIQVSTYGHVSGEIVQYANISMAIYSAENMFVGGGSLTPQQWPEFYAEQVAKKPHALPDGERLVIPADVQRIEESAFAGCGAQIVEIPDGCTAIGANAFGASSVKHILIPVSVTSIADDAFAGCTDVTIYGDLDSTAQAYAEAHGYQFLKH